MNVARYFFKQYVRNQVLQGPTHRARIEAMFREIREACYDEFNEDSYNTVDTFLTEIFEDSKF